jgi:hypothetical protein
LASTDKADIKLKPHRSDDLCGFCVLELVTELFRHSPKKLVLLQIWNNFIGSKKQPVIPITLPMSGES